MKKEKRARARRTGAQAAESGAARPAGGAGKTLRALGFAQKLTLAMLLVLAMALSLGGAVVLAGNFDDALNEAGQQRRCSICCNAMRWNPTCWTWPRGARP